MAPYLKANFEKTSILIKFITSAFDAVTILSIGMLYTQIAKYVSQFGNYQMAFSNKINYKLVEMFSKNPRFVKPVTKTVTNAIREATLQRHNNSLYNILVENVYIPPSR